MPRGGRSGLISLMAVLLGLVALGMPAVWAKPGGVTATRAELKVIGSRTSFILDLSTGVRAEIFTLPNPYRVIIDLPDVGFRLPQNAGQSGRGLVSAFRFGLLEEGKARIVLDTNKPVLIGKAEMAVRSGEAVRLTIELVGTTPQDFGAGTGGQRTAYAPLQTENYKERAKRPKNRAKPVILIDPGHGGIDPGTISASNRKEKAVVLAVAKKLREQLVKTGRYDVHMTRTRDVFVSLDERLRKSQELDADLFISLHADAIAQKNLAGSVRGATVYTLSEKASDETARIMAEKENASDAIAGLQTVEIEDQGEVRSILIDLLKRETANFSADLSNTLVKRLRKTISLSRAPQRSAAFKVLRQADTPSVLIELGYMSHKEDEKLLNSSTWQTSVAGALTTAIDSYFAKRTAKAR